MSMVRIAWAKSGGWMIAGVFLLAAGGPARGQTSVATTPTNQAIAAQDAARAFASNDSEEVDADATAEAQDRGQEAADRAQEAKDRAQEAKDRAQEHVERLEEAYDRGRDALDEDKFERAEESFAEVAKANTAQSDAALYWKAYAENKLGKRSVALATISDLKQKYPQSRWLKDAGALQIEVQQSSGQPSKPEAQSDDELKMLAIQGLMNSDPERAMPLLEKVLNGNGSPKEKSRAMFVMAQNGSPQSREILGRIASGQSNPDLQRKAVEYLGLFGGAEARKTLANVYATSSDVAVKRAVLKSFMLSGDKDSLFAAAKSEKDPGLRREAIRQLGLVHGTGELEQLYRSESAPELRREILQAFFLAGDTEKLVSVAQTEKDPEVRRAAVRNLGLVGGDAAGAALETIYNKETDKEVRAEVLNALFIQGNAKALVALARNEKDPELKKRAVEKLSLMNSKESTEYMMELLQK
jgi:HEAT repeat protein